jgi:hypothetical protein
LSSRNRSEKYLCFKKNGIGINDFMNIIKKIRKKKRKRNEGELIGGLGWALCCFTSGFVFGAKEIL